METVVRFFWLTMGFMGICLGVVRLFESAYLFLTARGNRQRIAEAKSIFCCSVMGMTIMSMPLFIIVFYLT